MTRAWKSVVALSGGVGGARLLRGLARALPPGVLTAVVNTGDDFEHWGLHVSPDVDTVMYALAGLSHEERGWGLADETFRALDALRAYGEDGWFAIGDRDLATHMARTLGMARGETLTQATARLCEGQAIPPPEAVARVESAAMVFVGELRAVHDLLYRPQETPEEPVLEAILAGLTSVFREFNELLRCVQSEREARPPALAASVKAMSRLAREICGDCVPRAFAPALRVWMDQIQRMASEVEQI